MSDTPPTPTLDGLCSAWATPEDCTCPTATSNPTLFADMLDYASFVLYELTGSQWPGECTDTVRPSAALSAENTIPVWHGQPLTSAYGGSWGWWQWYPSWGVCGCAGLDVGEGRRKIQLGAYPIVGIDEVKVDGVVLNPTEYAVEAFEWLWRLPNVGETTPRHWPCCQRLDLPDTEPDTFSVTFRFGSAPPRAGSIAAASLACDLAASCDPNSDCGIPERLARRLYENAEYDFRVVDDRDTLDDGFTGNRLADLFIASVNPEHIHSAPVVWSPDFGNRVHRFT